jgi:hypothetical protein
MFMIDHQSGLHVVGAFAETERGLVEAMRVPLNVAGEIEGLPEASPIRDVLLDDANDVLETCKREMRKAKSLERDTKEIPECWRKMWSFFDRFQEVVCPVQYDRLYRCRMEAVAQGSSLVDSSCSDHTYALMSCVRHRGTDGLALTSALEQTLTARHVNL